MVYYGELEFQFEDDSTYKLTVGPFGESLEYLKACAQQFNDDGVSGLDKTYFVNSDGSTLKKIKGAAIIAKTVTKVV